MFAISSMALFTALGAAVDLARVYSVKQKLSQNATLACQYASRPSVIGTSAASYSDANGGATYKSNVNSYISQNLTAQGLKYVQTTGTPFTYTQNGTADVTLSANVPTTLMQVIRVTQIPVSTTMHCYDSPASISQRIATNSNPFLVKESFEVGCTGACFTWYNPNGMTGTNAIPTSSPGTTVGFTGNNGDQWIIAGYCLEVGQNVSGIPDGTHSAELDCDNGFGSAGNSSISTKKYLPVGNYELRYNYTSRVTYAEYSPAYICGTTAGDVSWANDTRSFRYPFFVTSLRTNQINVYLDLNTNGIPPVHTTIDGTQSLAGANLIDVCVYSPSWIERSVRIKVTTAGYYWLSFAADGASDSYGGQIDNIRLCTQTCPGTLQDNFPSAWLPASGVNKVLFQDTFESPLYTQDPFTTSAHAKAGNPGLNTGTSGTSASGWPSQASSGWAAAPYNNVVYWMQGAYQGSQYFSLQGWNGGTNASDPINRSVSRKFLLVPGYYNVSYDYISMVDFGTISGLTSFCYTAPPTGPVYMNPGNYNGTIRYGSTVNVNPFTNILGVFMSHGSLVSTPSASTTPNAAPTYTNPDGTTSATPTLAPDTVNWGSYNAAAVNPVIDTCGYASGYTWMPRSVNIKITKPGWYWLTFSAKGDPLTSLGAGPAMDDVKLTALGSLYMSYPPTSALTTIPVAAPASDSQYTNSGQFTGFFIVADPLKPPAALQ